MFIVLLWNTSKSWKPKTTVIFHMCEHNCIGTPCRDNIRSSPLTRNCTLDWDGNATSLSIMFAKIQCNSFLSSACRETCFGNIYNIRDVGWKCTKNLDTWNKNETVAALFTLSCTVCCYCFEHCTRSQIYQ